MPAKRPPRPSSTASSTSASTLVADREPIACTLGERDLRQRLEAIAALGAESLIGYESEEGIHSLRFRRTDGTRRRLEQIVSAEAKCCSFLNLSIEEPGKDLVLSISAPAAGEPTAKALALAFRDASDIDHTGVG